MEFEIRHSLQETCIECKECKKSDCLERKPAEIFLTKKVSNLSSNSTVGDTMKGAIEEARQDLKVDKEILKKRVYKK